MRSSSSRRYSRLTQVRSQEFERRLAEESKSSSDGRLASSPQADPPSGAEARTATVNDPARAPESAQQTLVDRLEKENEALRLQLQQQETRVQLLAQEIAYANEPLGYDVGTPR